MKRITIFGGSQIDPGDVAYEQAFRLGKLLGEAGNAVLTGGYIGTMEAVSRGAAEAGGHVIGVTCDQIEKWRPVQPNPWIAEEMRFPTLRQRLFALIEEGEAIIVLPGGIGTLAELAEAWSHLQTGILSPRPLILVGMGWKAVFDEFFVALGTYVPEHYRGLLTFVATVDEAVSILDGE